MDIKLVYSKRQLEYAVKFIAKHNNHFLDQKDYIRTSIIENMREMAQDPNSSFQGTMGYLLVGDRDVEGIDCDHNEVRIEIYIDPALGTDYYEYEDDAISEELTD